MNWLTQAFEAESLAWLFLSSIVGLVSGVLSSWLTYRFVKSKEISDTARIEGEVRQKVEEHLGDKSADREYNLEARKRLYLAIGLLRFQLLTACKDLASRVHSYGTTTQYSMESGGYYGDTTLYRILRPIAIGEKIEQQMSYADFSVDTKVVDLLRFKKAAMTALTDGDAILGHPRVHWNSEREHLFSGTLITLASYLLTSDAGKDKDKNGEKRVMQFHEFDACLGDAATRRKFAALADILHDFTIEGKPLFWTRLVCYGYICNEYVSLLGSEIGFEKVPFDVRLLLSLSKDDYILKNMDGYIEQFRSLVERKL